MEQEINNIDRLNIILSKESICQNELTELIKQIVEQQDIEAAYQVLYYISVNNKLPKIYIQDLIDIIIKSNESKIIIEASNLMTETFVESIVEYNPENRIKIYDAVTRLNESALIMKSAKTRVNKN